MPKALLISAGGTEAPVIHTIEAQKPDYVIFLVSRPSRDIVLDKVLPSLSHQLRDREFIVTPNHEDLLMTTKEILSRVPKILSGWNLELSELGADFTGGTKAMSAAVVLALSRKVASFSYVGGVTRNKDGLGVVEGGAEALVKVQNPWDALAIDELKEISTLFNMARFEEASGVALKVASRSEIEKYFFEALSKSCKAYALWDDFRYKDALTKFYSAANCFQQMATVTDLSPCRYPSYKFVTSAKEVVVMRKSRFSEAQIIRILKQAEAGMTVSALCREHGMSDATFYKWRSKYGGLDVSESVRLRGLEEENRRLKRLVAELALDNQVLKEVLVKNG